MLSTATLVSLLTVLPAQPAQAFVLKTGDRVVWIGSTVVEREQRYGYWEAALHIAFPDANFTVRNLGWSGDTVFGEARAAFDPPAKGFERLVSLTLELKPTVIFVSYGANESFEGKEGLEKFQKGLEKLLDALKPANARIVLFSPMPYEKGVQTPNRAQRDEAIREYAKVIRTDACDRKSLYADFNALASSYYDAYPFPADNLAAYLPLTTNGVHLTANGYDGMKEIFLKSLGITRVSTSDSEALRLAIVRKNELFFHRWRPENETYLFGFRKHEQGKNAKEIVEFDPLVAKAEEEIEVLRKKLK